MEKSIKELIEESRERAFLIREQQNDDEKEKNRPRNIIETQRKIDSWKRQHKLKTVTPVRISIARQFLKDIKSDIYHIRLFIDGHLREIYRIEVEAAELLTKNIKSDRYSDVEIFRIYSNI